MGHLKLVTEINQCEFKSNRLEILEVEYKIVKTEDLPDDLKGNLGIWCGGAPAKSWCIIYRYEEQESYSVAAKFIKTRKQAQEMLARFRLEDSQRAANERRASMKCIFSAQIDTLERLRRNIKRNKRNEARMAAERQGKVNSGTNSQTRQLHSSLNKIKELRKELDELRKPE